jgi:ubiquitin carboxyl-terminal hydrolase 36/42
MLQIQQSKDLRKVDRRIEFHLAKKPQNGFNNSFTIQKTSFKTNTNSNDESKVKTNTANHGLFDPDIVLKVLRWQSPRRIGPGFFNQGNTCYLNSTLQCLLYLPPLTQALLNSDIKLFKTIPTNNQSMLSHFQKLVNEVSKGSSERPISPRSMVQNIRYVGKQFRPMRQEDAHEYLRKLIDCMHEEILKSYGVKTQDGKIAETTFIFRIFGGLLRNELLCSKCHYSSKTFNSFLDLSLEITKGVTSLSSAIKAFTQVSYCQLLTIFILLY